MCASAQVTNQGEGKLHSTESAMDIWKINLHTCIYIYNIYIYIYIYIYIHIHTVWAADNTNSTDIQSRIQQCGQDHFRAKAGPWPHTQILLAQHQLASFCHEMGPTSWKIWTWQQSGTWKECNAVMIAQTWEALVDRPHMYTGVGWAVTTIKRPANECGSAARLTLCSNSHFEKILSATKSMPPWCVCKKTSCASQQQWSDPTK
jgi:hypothetical protein